MRPTDRGSLPTFILATALVLARAAAEGGIPVLFASTLSVFADTDAPEGDFPESLPAPRGRRRL